VESLTADLPKALLPLKKAGGEGFPGRPFQNAEVAQRREFSSMDEKVFTRRDFLRGAAGTASILNVG
jgi:hypothetical protein